MAITQSSMPEDPAREAIFANVRAALGRSPAAPVRPIPPSGRVAPRTPGDPGSELAILLQELGKLTVITRRIHDRQELAQALADLVKAEAVTQAMLWTTAELREWGLAGLLEQQGVALVPADADKWEVARCELGVTGVDGALPETGTLLLRSAPDKPRVVSLLPRVHLALLRPSALRADLRQAFADVKYDNTFVCITGPSRTADIELTLTLGVHGPKTLYVWVMENL